ncbi:MAG: germination protein, Ger(x)C family [Firmicutes bacterium]|nr:germination protein, Ger(x)C family [Bacillota bacterium]
MYLRPITLLLFTVWALITTGCNGAKETDEVAYILSVGIDAAPNNQLSITYRIADPHSLAGGKDSQSQSQKSSILINLTAPSLTEGRNILKSIISREPRISHLKIFVISEELARKGLGDLFGLFMRHREYRGTVFLAIVRGSAKEVLEKNRPDLDVLTSRWVESMLQSYFESSYFLRADIYQFYKRLKNESGAPYAVLLGLNPLDGEDRANNEAVGNDRSEGYLAKQIPRQSGNPLEMCGTAVFKGDKLVGFLNNKETRALSILLGDLERGFMSLEDPLVPSKQVDINIHLGRKPNINVDISSTIPAITISVYLEGDILGVSSGTNYEAGDYKVLLEQQISNTIFEQITSMLKRTQDLGTDVVNFGYYIRPKFNTVQELENYHWDSKYPEAVIHLDVQTKLRRDGLMRKTTPIRKE